MQENELCVNFYAHVLNTKLQKKADIVSVNPPFYDGLTEDGINNFYNTVSTDMNNNTWYRATISNVVAHSIFSGGVYYLEGFKTNSSYEWQIITRYSLSDDINADIRIFHRSKNKGIWSNWIRK